MDVKFPIGKLQVPEKVTSEHVLKWMEEISTFTTRLEEVVSNLTEEDFQKNYREGSWNVRQLVHHIADSQLNMYQRLKLALTDDNPTVPAFNQDKWAMLPDNELPVKSSIDMLSGINERIVALGKSLSHDQLRRTFTLEDTDVITVATKLAKLSWHEEHHLAHIQIALSK